MKIIMAIVLALAVYGCIPEEKPFNEYQVRYQIAKHCIDGFVYYSIDYCCESGLTQAMGYDGKPVKCEE
jgi:hypothetical protein